MSIALSAIIVFILLLPGVIFRYLYFKSDSLRKTVDLSIINELVIIVLPTLILHSIGIWTIEQFTVANVRLDQLYYLIAPSRSGELLDLNFIETAFSLFIFYIISLCVIAGVLSRFFQSIVLKFGWDEKYKFLKIYNDWDKYFSGFTLPESERKKIDYVEVNVVVGGSNGDVLYCGILDNYSLNKDQGIDRIFLSSVFRRKLTDFNQTSDKHTNSNLFSKSTDDRYYNVSGSHFVIPFREVKNIMISYNSLEEENADFSEEE